jgi:hypothetical protein
MTVTGQTENQLLFKKEREARCMELTKNNIFFHFEFFHMFLDFRDVDSLKSEKQPKRNRKETDRSIEIAIMILECSHIIITPGFTQQISLQFQ